jgi:hypothetical protein
MRRSKQDENDLLAGGLLLWLLIGGAAGLWKLAQWLAGYW